MNRFGLASTALALAFTLAASARAAEPKVVAEIEAHDKAFLAAYENGETKKMKSEIGKAVALGEKNGLASDPMMADTYVLAAIFDVDGNDNAKAGVRDFVKALKLKADVAIPKGMATSGVKAALKQAREELGLLPKEGAGAVAAKTAEAPPKEQAAETPPEKTDKAEKADDGADKAKEAERTKQEQKAQQERDKQAADAKAREDHERQADKDKQDKQLAAANARVAQLEKDKADKDKQLAAANARVAQLEKDKADRERDRTGKLADKDKQLADKDKQLADKDKQLADLRAQASKDREALDKIARDKQAAEAQARADETKRKQAQQERERLFAGPELPRSLREPLTCAVPDEAPLRADIYVHCVARGNLKAKSIIFYYRTTVGGTSKYFTAPMERTSKGWYAAVVPGARVFGKVLQYYAEALDGREAVVARNGKESSPNILTLRPTAPRS